MKSAKKDQDIILGLIILLFSGVLWYQAGKLKGAPSIMPRLFIGMMAVAGAGIIINAIVQIVKTGKAYQQLTPKDFLWEAVIPGALLLIVYLLIDVLGFYICAFILITAVCVLQNIVINKKPVINSKNLIIILLFALGTTGFMFLCFSVLLSMPTPVGFLGI